MKHKFKQEFEEWLAKNSQQAAPVEQPQAIEEDSGDLIVFHSMSPHALEHAAEMGGLAAPSLGITHKDYPIDRYGPITFVGSPDMVDPGKGVPVFAADAYTPRHPRARYKIDDKKLWSIYDELRPYVEDLTGGSLGIKEYLESGGIDEVLGHRIARTPLRLAYLREKGHNIVAPTRKPPAPQEYPFADSDVLRQYVEKYGEEGLSDEYADALSDAVRRAIDDFYDSKIREFENKYPEDREFYREMFEKRRKRAHDHFDPETGRMYIWPLDQIRSYLRQGSSEVDRYKFEDLINQRFEELGAEEDFRTWVHEKLSPVLGDRYIPRITASGRMRYIPYTLENVLKEVTRKVRGGENFNYGVGNVRAKVAPKFRSIDEMRQARDRLVSDEDFEKIKQEAQDRFVELGEKLSRYYSYSDGALDSYSYAMQDIPTRGMERALREHGFRDVPEHLKQEIREFLNYLKTAPTEYFEAKPQRIVELREFPGVVVPKGTSQKILDLIRRQGIKHVEEYDPEDKQSRAEAIKRIARAQNLFLSEEKFGEILEKGVNQRLFPFDPIVRFDSETEGGDVSRENYRNLWDWTHESEQPARDEIVPMGDEARQRAINRLIREAQWRKNDKGELEFLLYRTMMEPEYRFWTDPSYTGESMARSSWAHRPVRLWTRTVGAWIPESAIISIPKQYGRYAVQWESAPGKNFYDDEDEIIIDNSMRDKFTIIPHDEAEALWSLRRQRQQEEQKRWAPPKERYGLEPQKEGRRAPSWEEIFKSEFEEWLAKARPTFKFPGLGLKDDRRETYMASAPPPDVMRNPISRGQQRSIEQIKEYKEDLGVRPDLALYNKARAIFGKENAGMLFPGAPVSDEPYVSGILGVSTGGFDARPVSVAIGPGPRPDFPQPASGQRKSKSLEEKRQKEMQEWMKRQKESMGVALHEDLHNMMARAEHTISRMDPSIKNPRERIAAYMMNSLDPELKEAVWLVHRARTKWQPQHYRFNREEAMASLLNYLNDPWTRQHVVARQLIPEGVDPQEYLRDLDQKVKRAYNQLGKIAASINSPDIIRDVELELMDRYPLDVAAAFDRNDPWEVADVLSDESYVPYIKPKHVAKAFQNPRSNDAALRHLNLRRDSSFNREVIANLMSDLGKLDREKRENAAKSVVAATNSFSTDAETVKKVLLDSRLPANASREIVKNNMKLTESDLHDLGGNKQAAPPVRVAAKLRLVKDYRQDPATIDLADNELTSALSFGDEDTIENLLRYHIDRAKPEQISMAIDSRLKRDELTYEFFWLVKHKLTKDQVLKILDAANKNKQLSSDVISEAINHEFITDEDVEKIAQEGSPRADGIVAWRSNLAPSIANKILDRYAHWDGHEDIISALINSGNIHKPDVLISVLEHSNSRELWRNAALSPNTPPEVIDYIVNAIQQDKYGKRGNLDEMDAVTHLINSSRIPLSALEALSSHDYWGEAATNALAARLRRIREQYK